MSLQIRQNRSCTPSFELCRGLFEVVDDGGDHAHVFHVGGGLRDILDRELALRGRFHLANLRAGILGETVGGLTGGFGGLGDHVGLDGVEGAELIVYI